MESSKKKRNSVLPIIVSVGIATSMGVVANSTPEVAYASSNAAASASTSTATYTDRSSSEDNKNQVITFKDPVLKSKLLAVMKDKQLIDGQLIDEDATDITIADAEKLTQANLSNRNIGIINDSNTISDLTGLEHFKNLVYLNFEFNKVSKLDPLKNLTSLEELYFSNNKVSDLKPLKDLTSLKSLDFSYNQVSDLTPLGDLSLKSLYFTDNQVSDLSPLWYLDSLDTLDFSDNKVSDLATLENLISLKNLYFSGNQVSDLTPLKDLTGITELVFSNNKVSDLAQLKNLTSLEELYFSGNQVSDLTTLKNLTSLKRLSFSGNQVSDLTPLKNLTSLKRLSFSGNKVSVLTPLKDLTNLNTLEIGNQTISIQSNDKETALPVSDVTFTIQGDDNSIGSITNGVFTLGKDLPYSGTISIKFEHDNIKIGSATSNYTGIITLKLNVPKIEVLHGVMKYEADPNLDYKKTNVTTAAKDGTKKKYADGSEQVVNPAQEGLTKVGNVNKTTTKIPFKTTYVADDTLPYERQEDKTAGKDGSTTVTTTYKVNPDTGLTTEVDSSKEDKVDPTNHVIRVGNKQVTTSGNTTTTITYDVNPNTGELSNPKKHTSMPAGTLTGSTKTEILHGVMKYEADSSLDYNTQKKISDPVDGKKVITSVINGEPKVEITPAKNGLTKVGNKQVTHEGNKTITTTYTVDPDTGALSNPNSKITVTPAPSHADGEAIEPQFAAMYRLYNPYTHEHLFTTDAAEKDNLVSLGWNFENVTGKVYMHSEKGGVYRLYNPTTGEHHYTTKEDELTKCVKAGWKNEGVKFFSVLDADKQTVGMVSMYNPYEKKFYHHYTSDPDEIAKMVKDGWRKEDVKWYAAK